MSRRSWNQEELVRTIVDLTERSPVGKSSADPRSLYSDNFSEADYYWDVSVRRAIRRKPDELIAALLVISAVKPFWYETFLAWCSERCYSEKYEGKWRNLHQLCKVQLIVLQLHTVQEMYTPEEFFGNIFKRMTKFNSDPTVRFLRQKRPESIRPQRKSGYNDKGSMKKAHEIHSAWKHSGPNKKRPDYRTLYKRKNAFLNYLY